MTTQTKSKKSVVERSEPIQFSTGVEGLLGPVASSASFEVVDDSRQGSVESQTRGTSREGANHSRAGTDDDPMTILSLRFHKSYQDRLDTLFLQEKLKNKRVKKWHLLEEAIELLLEKYGYENRP